MITLLIHKKLLFVLISILVQTNTTKSLNFTKIKQTMGQTISTSQWYVYGRRHFTKSGYERHLKEYKDPVQSIASIGRNVNGSDGVDLDGKVVVVTGANSGIGKEIATYAAAKGAKLYMLCRTQERAENARKEIIETTQNENIKILLADTGELSQIRTAMNGLDVEPSIHCLVCNAGALSNDKQLTSEGNEVTIGSHLFGGSYLLSKLLLPKLMNAAENGQDPRVIYVSSGGMYNTKFPSWDEATNTATNQKYDGVMAYAYAKRGQILIAEQFSKLFPKIKWVSCHPGWVDTIGVDEAFGSDKKYFNPLRSKWEGSEGIAWLMGTKGENLRSGEFYLDRKPQTKHIAGPFMTEGSFTKNTDSEIDEFMKMLYRSCDA